MFGLLCVLQINKNFVLLLSDISHRDNLRQCVDLSLIEGHGIRLHKCCGYTKSIKKFF